MFKKFLSHINSKNFFNKEDRIVIGVSGGADSMALCHLMHCAGYEIAIAHVNHMTRNGGSDADEQFVRAYCHENNIPWHFKRLDPRGYSEGNFQDYSHRERYRFFESLGYDRILTAHHKDDNIETVILNFLRGRSLAGIPETRHNIVRPLLPFSKNDILRYVDKNDIPWVKDISNSSSIYDRNYIRNEILPQLEERIPNLKEKIMELSGRWTGDMKTLGALAESYLQTEKQGGRRYLDISQVRHLPKGIIYHIIREYGFNRSQAGDIERALDNTGAQFYGNGYALTIARERIYIDPDQPESDMITIDILNNPTVNYNGLSCSLSIRDQYVKSQESHIAYFPIKMLSDQIALRPWKSGDHFHPYGLEGKSQSLKKFFTNSKIDRHLKKRIPVLVNGEDIIWVIPYRTNHFYDPALHEGPFLRIECSFTQ